MPKFKLEVDGLDKFVERLSKLEGNVKETAEKALSESKDYVTSNLKSAMDKHNRTFNTVGALDKDKKVEWAGDIGTIHVGFNIREGGLPSIFLMYGTPRTSKDSNLYNAVYGANTKAKVKEIQENTFYNEIRKLGG